MHLSFKALSVAANISVKKNTHSLIINYLEKLEFGREVENYKILLSLDIPTLNIIATTDKALLMDDICESNRYRLGVKEDLDHSIIVSLVAEWYRLLNPKGATYIRQNDQAKIFMMRMMLINYLSLPNE